jgi:transcriptional regulator with XRE-family HTH domain
MRYATVDGPKLRELRKERALSLRATAALIAERLGLSTVHVTTLSKIETGDRQPSDELFDAWCDVLGGDRDKLVQIAVPPELADHIHAAVAAALPSSTRAGAA